MDTNSAIGLTLIALLLLVYFYLFSPSSVTPETKTVTRDSTIQRNSSTIIDSAAAKQYDDLGLFLPGKQEFTSVENDVLKLRFSSYGTLRGVNLKNFKTYNQQPLLLAENDNNKFSLLATYKGHTIDLYQLNYQLETLEEGDTTKVILIAKLSETSFLRHVYSIPSKGYHIYYSIESHGIPLGGKHVDFSWIDFIAPQEKDLKDSRGKTTINYYLAANSFDGLSESSSESRSLTEPLKWVAIKQKFFLSAIFAKEDFASGSLAISVDPNDSSIIKTAAISLSIPLDAISTKKANFSYYFGPNDYKITKEVATGFSRNMYIGWPPVIWVNTFLLMPVFNFLQTLISNYGIIILLLVLFMKLLLMPLTYSSYMGMAKMRLLKPELDAIKEKNGDNLTQTQQDQMRLYQQAGVNPYSGCIPLIIQMPVLLSMFYLFPNSIDLRQRPFLWAEDLSTWDSIVTLPFSVPFGYGNHLSLFVLLMTASQLVFQWQNNQLQSLKGPMKSIGYVMPIIFLFYLNSFSAGLSFYYFVSNVITFAQQAIIKHFVSENKIKAIMDENRKKATSGMGKKSKFIAKLEDAMKFREEARKKTKK